MLQMRNDMTQMLETVCASILEQDKALKALASAQDRLERFLTEEHRQHMQALRAEHKDDRKALHQEHKEDRLAIINACKSDGPAEKVVEQRKTIETLSNCICSMTEKLLGRVAQPQSPPLLQYPNPPTPTSFIPGTPQPEPSLSSREADTGKHSSPGVSSMDEGSEKGNAAQSSESEEQRERTCDVESEEEVAKHKSKSHSEEAGKHKKSHSEEAAKPKHTEQQAPQHRKTKSEGHRLKDADMVVVEDSEESVVEESEDDGAGEKWRPPPPDLTKKRKLQRKLKDVAAKKPKLGVNTAKKVALYGWKAAYEPYLFENSPKVVHFFSLLRDMGMNPEIGTFAIVPRAKILSERTSYLAICLPMVELIARAMLEVFEEDGAPADKFVDAIDVAVELRSGGTAGVSKLLGPKFAREHGAMYVDMTAERTGKTKMGQWIHVEAMLGHRDAAADDMLFMKTDDFWTLQFFTGPFVDYSDMADRLYNTKVASHAREHAVLFPYLKSYPMDAFKPMDLKALGLATRTYSQLVGRCVSIYKTERMKVTADSFRKMNSWRNNVHCKKDQYWFTRRLCNRAD